MKQHLAARVGLAFLLVTTTIGRAHEWKSADGKKTFEAAFISVQGTNVKLNASGKPVAFPLSAFAAEDQQFAKNAQAIADAATKWGQQSLELGHFANGGWLGRLAIKKDTKAGPILFTGETIFLATSDAAKHKQGDTITDQLLFAAGGRTYHPLQGAPSPIRAFALDAEHATKAWSDIMAQSGGDVAKQSPPVLEPDIEIITTRGLGVIVGKGGFIAIHAALLKDAKTIAVHHDGKDHPAVAVQLDDKLGLAILTCALALEPARLAAKKPAELGQSIFALSLELSSTKKTIASKPTLTRGIISRITTRGDDFLHDATLPPESLGGFIVGDKGDVLGLYFQDQTTGKSTAKKAPAPANDAPGLSASISTGALATLLGKVPGVATLRGTAGSTEMEQLGKSLQACTVLVITTREVNQPRSIATLKITPKAVPLPGAAAGTPGWSLSKAGTRHNAKCRFYKPDAPCQSTDGKPCKVCGG